MIRLPRNSIRHRWIEYHADEVGVGAHDDPYQKCDVWLFHVKFATGELCFALSLSLLLRKIQLPPGGRLNVGVGAHDDPYDVGRGLAP